MATVGARTRLSCRLQFNMHCRCMGCDEKVENAMASIGSFRGAEKWEGDLSNGMVTVTGKVNPVELCQWLKGKTGKDVKIVCPDLSVDNRKQKIISGRGNSSGSGSTTRSAPSSRSCSSGSQSDRKELKLIEDKIRDLEKDKDRLLKIKNQKKKLAADNSKFNEVIDDTKKVVLDGAYRQLKAYEKLESLRRARMGY